METSSRPFGYTTKEMLEKFWAVRESKQLIAGKRWVKHQGLYISAQCIKVVKNKAAHNEIGPAEIFFPSERYLSTDKEKFMDGYHLTEYRLNGRLYKEGTFVTKVIKKRGEKYDLQKMS